MLHASQRRKISYKAMQNVDFAAVVYLSEAPSPTVTPCHTPAYTLYIHVYSILIHTGKGEGRRVEPESRLEGQQFTKLGRKYQHD
jgi:hypothetical protein